jgi:hypothetical protein
MINWKGCGRKRYGRIVRWHPSIPLERLKEATNTSVRIGGFWIEI